MTIHKNIGLYIYFFSFILSVSVYLFIKQTVAWEAIQIIKLTQYFAIIAAIYLYLTLLAYPFSRTFSNLSFSKQYMQARNALGISSFYFALIHFLLAFFGQLGGFAGLTFLDTKNIIIMSLGFIALIILSIFSVYTMRLILKNQTYLYNMLYAAGVLIAIHAVMMQVHFSDISSPLALVFFFAIVFLLLLIAPNIDALLMHAFNIPTKLRLSFVIIILISFYLLLTYGPWSGAASVKNKEMNGMQMAPVQGK